MPINCHSNKKIGKIMNFLSQFEWLDALKWRPKMLMSVSLVLVQKTTNEIDTFLNFNKKVFFNPP